MTFDSAVLEAKYAGQMLEMASAIESDGVLQLKLGYREHELFAPAYLDTRHRLIEYVELFHGTIDGAEVHLREVVRLAIAVCRHVPAVEH